MPGSRSGRAEGRVPGWRPSPERAATGVHPGRAVEGSEPAGTGQAPGSQPLDHPTGGQVAVGVEIAASARSMAVYTTKQPCAGTGLGLSICHGTVTQHGGEMWATSEKGFGTSFFVPGWSAQPSL